MTRSLRFSLFLLAFTCLGVFRSSAQSLAEPSAYMSFIGEQHREIMKDYLSYTSAVAHGKSARKVEKRRQNLLQTTSDARRKVTQMPPFEGDKSLRDTTAAFLLISHHILNDEYGKIVNLEEVAEQSYDAMEAYLLTQELANDKLDKAFEKLKKTEKIFADTHHVQLIESKDELTDKLKKASDVNEYHTKIYLIFFKSYKQEVYMLDALQNKNINSVEQNRNTLLKYADVGIAKLDTVRSFNGDKSLVTACHQLLDFYKSECKDKITSLTAYYLKEENFQKIKKAFDAKREKDRTQADVDQYNKAGAEVNKAVNEYNNTSKQLSDLRGKLIDGWNKASQNFLDKHVPQYK